MAARKTARRKTAPRRATSAGKPRPPSRKAAARKSPAKTIARKKSAAKKTAVKKAAVVKATPKTARRPAARAKVAAKTPPSPRRRPTPRSAAKAPAPLPSAGAAATLLGDLIARARKAGADAADAVLVESAAVSVAQRLGKPEKLERAESRDLGLRVFIGKLQAIVSTTDTAPATLPDLVERAVAMARTVPDDPFCGLADPADLRIAAEQLPDGANEHLVVTVAAHALAPGCRLHARHEVAEIVSRRPDIGLRCALGRRRRLGPEPARDQRGRDRCAPGVGRASHVGDPQPQGLGGALSPR